MEIQFTHTETNKRLLAMADDIFDIVQIYATGEDPFERLKNIDVPIDRGILMQVYRDIVKAAKSNIPKVKLTDRYQSKSDKEQAEAIIQDVMDGTLEVDFAKDLLTLMASKVNHIEMIHLKEKIEQAGNLIDGEGGVGMSTTINFNVHPPKTDVKVTRGEGSAYADSHNDT